MPETTKISLRLLNTELEVLNSLSETLEIDRNTLVRLGIQRLRSSSPQRLARDAEKIKLPRGMASQDSSVARSAANKRWSERDAT